MTSAASRRIVLGIGNPDRGDDAAGRRVARLLRRMMPDEVDVAEHDGEATALLARLDGATAAYLVDACASGAPVGTVHRFDASAAPLPQAAFGLSTHGFGLAEAVELARALGQLPARCIVYAIEGESFEIGAPLSPPVSAAVAEVVRCLRAEIADIAKAERAQRATGVSVWLGALSHFSAEHFAEHFKHVSDGTLAASARLNVTVSEDLQDTDAQEIMPESVEVET